MAKRQMTDEQRERWNAYSRKYRAEHPEKVRRWRQDYILRKASALAAAQAAGGDDRGGD
jgi:hypothetical protein